MPDRPEPSTRLVADLHLDVGDENGTTSMSLTGDSTDGLVLDVANPAVALRFLPRREVLPGGGRPARFAGLADTRVVVTSRDHTLARGRITTSGGVRLRPTVAALPTLARVALAALKTVVRPRFRPRSRR